MKTLRMFSRLIIAVVFIFSGFVKAVDPLGFAYKFTDYFNAFHVGFLEVIALPLAIALSAAELVIGISMLLSYRVKFMSWLVLVFMLFFTGLTFILALYNPVSDCGCFGDAIILTNWQTFFKNLILMPFVLIVFTGRDKFLPMNTPTIEWSVVSLFYVAVIFLSVYCIRNLPMLDFRPYHVGADIKKGMVIPPDAPLDEYETTLLYKSKESGKILEYNMKNFPRDTVKWEFVDAKSELVKKGYEPPIHDFTLSTEEGSDITDYILNDPAYSMLLIAHDINDADDSGLIEANRLFELTSYLPGFKFYAVTSSTSDIVENRSQDLGLNYDFLYADEIMLKTVIRSNPGFVLLNNGVVVGKWHFRNFPEYLLDEYRELLSYSNGEVTEDHQRMKETYDLLPARQVFTSKVLEEYHQRQDRRIIYTLLFGFFTLIFLLRTYLKD